MRDADDEIREIKTEIIESRALIIKTNNLTNSLAADIKAIARRQLGYERRFTWNSAVAYVLFATLSFVGLKLWSAVRVDEMVAEQREQARQVEQLRRDLGEETRRAERREQAEAKAAAYYELIRKKDYARVVEGYDDIRQEQLSKTEAELFRDSESHFRLQLSVLAYQNGLNLTRTGRYADAVEALQEAVRLKEDASYIPAVKLELARDLLHVNRPGEAALLAQEVIDQTVDKDLQDDGAWVLSQAAEDLGNIENARTALRLLQRKWPHSSLANDARKRLNELK
jgi:TolA-binding protein